VCFNEPKGQHFSRLQITNFDPMIAEIISIGDELLLGQTINTNASWMGEQLHLAGFKLRQVSTISDERAHILSALSEAESRADLILITGGLGPTKDDITKTTLCEYFETDLVMNDHVLQGITAYFNGRGLPMLDVNAKQAELPRAAEVIENTRGTAMGMWFNKDKKAFVSMPGVPHEMKGMMMEQVLPRLKERFKTDGSYYQVLHTVGVGESFIADKIADWETRIRAEGLGLAYLPSPGTVKLRVSGTIVNAAKVDEECYQLESLLGDIVFGRNEATLPGVVGMLLRQSNKSLSVAESCTGGFLGHLITSVPGSSDYFKGGVLSYSNEMKISILGVDTIDIQRYGAVSELVVKQMAEGVRKITGADYAIATSGVAGPDGGTDENPVGTVWMAVSEAQQTTAIRYVFGKSRERNIALASNYALNLLRKRIIERQ
jgi:nicotinamide-nucleotide amidase